MLDQKGYTTLELLILMLILALLAAIGLPGIRDTLDRNARDIAVQQMMTALALARAEAVTKATPVSLCRSVNTAVCSSGSNGDWRNGWLIFEDRGTPGIMDLNDLLIKANAPSSSKISITARTAANANIIGDYFRFDAEGFLIYPVGGGYLKFCHPNNTLNFTRAVWVAATGRSSYSLHDSDGIQNDINGGNLLCP
jgi:type IV fimbrial biogenesis protein FimT